MSESLKHQGEHKHEKLNLETETRQNLERLREKAEKAQEAAPEYVEHIKSKVETHAVSGKEYTVGEREHANHTQHHHVNQKQLKADSYNKTMRGVQKQLSKPNKALSKVIHNKTVETTSEIGAKTIARPSGILGGGIFALAGSSFLLYMSKHYGFEYNYLLFIVLFIGGFFAGMLVELFLRSVLKKT